METTTGAKETIRRTTDKDQLTVEIVTAVAELNGVSSMELDEKLHDVIDPDGLEMIFATESDTPPSITHVAFTMAGCEVVVYSDFSIIVTPQRATGRETEQFEVLEKNTS